MERAPVVIPTSHLIPFVVASMLIIIVPGPSVLFTLARAVAWGRTVAVLTVLGNSVGTLLLSALVALGLGPLLQRYGSLSRVIQLAGGLYLIYLGVEALKYRRQHAAAMTATGEKPSLSRIVRQGFTVGVLNPKSLIFFAAIFPHFVDRHHGSVTVQLLALGVLFSVMAFCSDSTWGIVAGTAREWLAGDPRRLVALRTTGGVVMCGLGVSIVGAAAGL